MLPIYVNVDITFITFGSNVASYINMKSMSIIIAMLKCNSVHEYVIYLVRLLMLNHIRDRRSRTFHDLWHRAIVN